jgi:carboxynorspermidine decarboxylase
MAGTILDANPKVKRRRRRVPGAVPRRLRRVVAAVETPALVLDLRTIDRTMQLVQCVRAAAGCAILYALKPLAHPAVLAAMRPHVDGFAASSAFEARLARSTLGASGSVHITSPGLRPDEAELLGRLCDHVVFNSLEQLRRLQGKFPATTHLGLRVNPRLSLVEDERYDPCRPASKLGVPLDRLKRVAATGRGLERISGLHFHTQCEGTSFIPLLRTVEHLIDRLDPLLRRLRWINLGGGYALDPPEGLGPLVEAVQRLRERYNLAVLIEPGAALVRSAGSLVATVIDLFRSGRKRVAVLDTTVNHMPEVFEYQFEPDVLGDRAEGEHEYILAGGTCLAGDVFGEYGFDGPLRVGSRVVFPDAGAYTMVKSHMFNGINLPAVYVIGTDGAWGSGHRPDYRDFLRRCGVDGDGAI